MNNQPDLFGFKKEPEVQLDSKYTHKIKAPIYEPKGDKPHIVELMNTYKSALLIAEIKSSMVSDDEKKFLIQAAKRHTVFNYSRIADYYAQASTEMQGLMEKSALVIIDFNKAIEYGFVKLCDEIEAIQEAQND